MKITMIGAGYVGLVSGACFADFGHDVVCVDVSQDKIDALHAGRMPIYEPGLAELVKANVDAGRLTFTTDLGPAAKGADAIFIAVGTPSRRGDGHADLSYVYQAAKDIAGAVDGPIVVVNKSTVPVGTGDEVERILRENTSGIDFAVVSNPEFLREGAAIGDFMRPDRIVLGVEEGAAGERALNVLRRLYRPLYLIETPIVATGLETAEIIKYAANAFLAMKISFINEVADLCEKAGADVQQVSRGIGLDGRIGRKFLHAGAGYGGSCFPKDTLAFARTGQALGAPLRLVETTIAVNDSRKIAMADRVIEACGGSVAGKTIGILGLTFKPETDDMRDAPSLEIVPKLVAAGATIRAYDPEGMGVARPLLPEAVHYVQNALEAASGAEALVLLTEWNEFRNIAPEKLVTAMSGRILLDLRNVYDPPAMREAGFTYHSIGRP